VEGKGVPRKGNTPGLRFGETAPSAERKVPGRKLSAPKNKGIQGEGARGEIEENGGDRGNMTLQEWSEMVAKSREETR